MKTKFEALEKVRKVRDEAHTLFRWGKITREEYQRRRDQAYAEYEALCSQAEARAIELAAKNPGKLISSGMPRLSRVGPLTNIQNHPRE